LKKSTGQIVDLYKTNLTLAGIEPQAVAAGAREHTRACGFDVFAELRKMGALIAPIQKNFPKFEIFPLTRKGTPLQSGHKVGKSSG
jgi:hypothetical protein